MSHGAVELNPFVNLIFDELNMQSVAIFKLLMLLFLLLLSRHMKGWTLALFAATTAIYVLVALYHWGWHHTLAHH